MSALGTTEAATMGGPGMLWNVALNSMPQRTGYTPLSLTSVWNGGAM